MKRAEIATKISENLDDLGITFYSKDDLNDSIQDALDEIVVYSECLDREWEIPFEDNLTYYNLHEIIPDFYRIVRIWYPGISQFFGISSDRNELNYRLDWELRVANPRDLIIAGPNRIAFWGRHNGTTDKFKVFYKATAPALNDDMVIPINTNYMHLIENYCTADLLEQNEEFSKAMNYWNVYEPELENYKYKIQLLARSDRVYTRSFNY